MKLRIGMLALIGAMGVGAASFAIASPLLSTEPIGAAATWDYTAAINHYNNGSKDSLFSNLRGKLSPSPGTSYDSLWDVYAKVYIQDDGTIKDYYSNATHYLPKNHSGNSSEGAGYNREHSIPKSWWGGAKTNQGCDPIIVIPTDAWVNNMRSNYAFGECSTVDKQSKNGYSKLGHCDSSYWGYSGQIFEPNDEVKGDLARIVFYAITKYSAAYGWRSGNGVSTFSGNESVDFGLTPYAVKLLTKWHNLDKPDAWERTVNDRLETNCNLRNPYIDHPEFVSALWDTGTPYVPGEGEDPIGSISLDKTYYSGEKGGNFQLTATSSAGTSINWSKSSNAVSLSSTSSLSGKAITVTLANEGTATIYAQTTIEEKVVKAACTVSVYVPVTSLYYEGAPAYVEYWDGDDFDPVGITVYATTSEGVHDVTDQVVWDDLEVGDTSVTGHYADKTVTVNGIYVNEDTSSESSGDTVTLDGDDFESLSTTEGNQTITKGGASFSGYIKRLDSSNEHYLWLSKLSDTKAGYFYNTTSLGSIKKITLNYSSGGSADASQCVSFGTSALGSRMTSPVNGKTLTTSPKGQSNQVSPSEGGKYGFFNISITNGKNLQVTSMVIETEEASYGAESFASDFLRFIACDYTGASEPTFPEDMDWDSLAYSYVFLSDDEKLVLKNGMANPAGTIVERCLARYDLIVAKYGYENFMDRNVQSLALNYSFGLSENSPNVAIIVAAILGASIAGVGGYLLIKKSSSKKRKD